VSADLPLTGDELATIKARQHDALVRWPHLVTDTGAATLADLVASDVPRLVAEIERLRAREHALLLHLDEAERAARRA
jgi:hypothetical protein